MSAPSRSGLYEPKIRVRHGWHSTIVGGSKRSFSTLQGARKWAHAKVGPHPKLTITGYADGPRGAWITVQGVTLAELFPEGEP
jgi:hypothetical protein